MPDANHGVGILAIGQRGKRARASGRVEVADDEIGLWESIIRFDRAPSPEVVHRRDASVPRVEILAHLGHELVAVDERIGRQVDNPECGDVRRLLLPKGEKVARRAG